MHNWTGKCRFELAVEIGAGAARFDGNYAVLLEEAVPSEEAVLLEETAQP